MPNFYLNPIAYALWSKNDGIRYNSTSGGAFSEFAKIILAKGGDVVGARYNQDNLVEHAIVSSEEELYKIRQSKYLSSSMGDIYKEVKFKLNNGKLIGFCGTPCQVAGLYSFLGKEYDNLLTFEFICRGTNSPKAFKAWLDEIEYKEGSRVSRVWFKYKDGGWKSSPRRTRVDFEDGHYKVYEGEKNLYMYGYLSSNLYIRPSCGNCVFKGVPRHGDITLADFWGIEESLDDDKGTSLVLINSDKGMDLFDETKNHFNYYERDFNDVLKGNPMFESSAVVPEKAHDFLKDLDVMTFSDALKKYGGYPKKRPLLKRMVKRTVNIIKKVKL